MIPFFGLPVLRLHPLPVRGLVLIGGFLLHFSLCPRCVVLLRSVLPLSVLLMRFFASSSSDVQDGRLGAVSLPRPSFVQLAALACPVHGRLVLAVRLQLEDGYGVALFGFSHLGSWILRAHGGLFFIGLLFAWWVVSLRFLALFASWEFFGPSSCSDVSDDVFFFFPSAGSPGFLGCPGCFSFCCFRGSFCSPSSRGSRCPD